jgi:CPA2 family monovalent cation:H+ antiporter-2
MLFDPAVLVDQPLQVMATVAIIVCGKSIAAVALVLAFRYRVNTALTVSASLAQIGEFSFILAGLGVALGLLPKEGQSLILAGAILSIALNPLVFGAIDPVRRWLSARPALAGRIEPAANPMAELPMSTDARYLSNQVVLIGWGRVGKRIAEALTREGVPFVVADENREAVQTLRERGVPAVWGNATEAMVLVQAHIRDARALVIATPETVQVRQMVEIARTLNPSIAIVVRSHNAEEAARLESEGAGTVFVAERELAASMVRHVLALVEPAGSQRRH